VDDKSNEDIREASVITGISTGKLIIDQKIWLEEFEE
jgi:hypothetical protein